MLVPSAGKPAITESTGLRGPVGACQDQPITISWKSQVGGASPPNLVPLGLEEQCHGFRPVVVAALGGHHHLPIEAELDDDPEPGQLVIA